ncbi:MAG: ATP-dependent DNA helicase [Steroidobacteraceae bacterium]
MQSIADIFGPQGPLARSLPGYRPRRSQLAMAERVAEAIAHAELLVVEAGTGTGKTFAYLVPALLSGARVLLSTGTRTLQDQLYARDLPLVARAIGAPARVALLKGRANYLCRQRFTAASSQLTLDGHAAPESLLSRIENWSRTTSTGDLAEVDELADSHPLWPQITSTRENCLGTRCADYARCHVVEARRRANESDVVIVNHHLLLADLALKEDGFGDILGSADAIVLDEAHQIPDLATQFFASTVSARQVDHLLRDARAELALTGAGTATAVDELYAVDAAARALVGLLAREPRVSFGDDDSDLDTRVGALRDALRALNAALDEASREAAIVQCATRASDLAASLEAILDATDTEGARTIEAGARGFALGLIPFDVAERFRGITAAHRAAWVFTSATLSIGDDFSHFASRLGLADADTLRIESPFDYESQSLLYLPADLPEPADPSHTSAVLAEALPLVQAAAGGAFILFTSHRALGLAAGLIRDRVAAFTAGPLLVQGEAPREQLLRTFREAGNAVLLGTTSFWEGVDVQGDALRLVVIEKLPFASPDDTLTKARIEILKRRGGNAFRDYQLPEAALALKQGVGRLIRSEADRGVVVICDPRMTNKSYGRVFRAALPPMRVSREPAEAVRFLARIAREMAAPPRTATAGRAVS